MSEAPLMSSEFAGLDLLATMVVVVRAEGECLFANAAFENVMRLSRRAVHKAHLPDWFDDAGRLIVIDAHGERHVLDVGDVVHVRVASNENPD